MDIKDIIKKIEDFAPLDTMQPWDNSGWQIDLGIKNIDRIMPVLDVTPDIIEQAAKNKCGLIISHHPVFFNPVKKIAEPYIIKAVQNNIQIYSAHTNLDAAKGGMTDYLARKCGFDGLETAFDFVRFKRFNEEKSFADLILKLKSIFNQPVFPIVNSLRKTYKSIAFCSGSGGEFIQGAAKLGIDVYISGDIKHHAAQHAGSLSVIDIGHFNSEKFAAELFAEILSGIDAEFVYAEETPAWTFV